MSILSGLLLALSSPAVVHPAPVLVEAKPVYRAQWPASCQKWRAARAGSTDEQRMEAGVYAFWVQGYITGFNVVGPDSSGDLLGNAPFAEFSSALDGYCQRQPANTIADGMRPIAEAFLRRRGWTPPSGLAASKSKQSAQTLFLKNCADWKRSRPIDVLRIAYANGIRGYVTAYNQWGREPSGDAIGGDDQTLIEQQLGQWCDVRDTELIIGAITPMIEFVRDERAAGRMAPAGEKAGDGPTDPSRKRP